MRIPLEFQRLVLADALVSVNQRNKKAACVNSMNGLGKNTSITSFALLMQADCAVLSQPERLKQQCQAWVHTHSKAKKALTCNMHVLLSLATTSAPKRATSLQMQDAQTCAAHSAHSTSFKLGNQIQALGQSPAQPINSNSPSRCVPGKPGPEAACRKASFQQHFAEALGAVLQVCFLDNNTQKNCRPVALSVPIHAPFLLIHTGQATQAQHHHEAVLGASRAGVRAGGKVNELKGGWGW
eukprot:1137180-Pelagomonas_calceolata.AAC.1